MKVNITSLNPLYPAEVFLQWEVAPDAGFVGTYAFDIQRSGSPEGEWDTIATGQSGITFTDDFADGTEDEEGEPNTLSLNREIYYRVKATATPTAGAPTVAYSPPVNLDGLTIIVEEAPIPAVGPKVDDADQRKVNQEVSNTAKPAVNIRSRLLRRKILREQLVGMKKLYGVEAKVLKRRHFGTFCTECRDPLTRSQLKSKCMTCYGTAFVGGFFTPIDTYIKLAPQPVQGANGTGQGPTTQRTTLLTMLCYPRVEKDDIIVELRTGKRWIVVASAMTELRRVIVHQRITVNELAHGSVEYSVPV